MIISLLAISVITFGVIAFAIYAWNNRTYATHNAKKTLKAGFNKKDFHLSNSYRLAYMEGPKNGPPLLLIHAQAASKRSYDPVLPALSETFHVFALDIIGHGESDRAPTCYTLSKIGNDIAEFIEKKLYAPIYLSGHSSGGLIAAWLAANKSNLIKATLYEDPPFFSTTKNRMSKQFNYVDLARPSHQFLNQSVVTDFASYYLEHNAWIGYFGGAGPNIARQAQSFRKAHPDKSINIWYLPPKVNESYADMHQFDPLFAARFYDYSWFGEVDQKELLAQITQPSILIHANWRITKEGILEGAMTDDDAQLACNLMKNCRIERAATGHGFHVEDPKRFVQLARELIKN